MLAALSGRLWLERRELTRDLGRLQRATRHLPPGLPVGTAAPDFELPDLNGEVVTLTKLRDRGLPVLLAFVHPTCGPCRNVFPELARWQRSLAHRITIVLMSGGSPGENRPAAEEHGLANILLAPDDEVMTAYRVRATPTAVVVNATGDIGSQTTETDRAFEALVRVTLRNAAPQLEEKLVVIPPAQRQLQHSS
jgi:methylamine dehydrogenase accessory protein MauD